MWNRNCFQQHFQQFVNDEESKDRKLMKLYIAVWLRVWLSCKVAIIFLLAPIYHFTSFTTCVVPFYYLAWNELWIDHVQIAEVAQYYKSMAVCNSLHLNKGETNKNSLRWHVNWQTNCLICVLCVKGAFPQRGWGQPKFTSDWSLMAHDRFYCTVTMVTKLFSRFPAD